MAEISFHERVVRYFRDAIAAYASEWFVTGNVCIYWERGNTEAYCAPDVYVARERLSEPYPRVYQLWRDPPIDFVVEVSSNRTAREEESTRLARFQNILRVPEHLYFDPDNQILRLRRLGPGGYEVVDAAASGRLESEQLGLTFALDDEGFPWIYTPGGERLLTHEEEVIRRQDAEARLTEEADRRQEAEARLAEEAHRRQEAEVRAAEEAEARTAETERRQTAEARATEEAGARAAEAQRRQAAEARATEEASRREELERQLAALRAQLEQRDGPA